MDIVTSKADLREILGSINPIVVDMERQKLHAIDREWLAVSPLCLVSTINPDGGIDISPKGDPAGFAHVIDDHTLALPERPGNRRADTFNNLLDNDAVGLWFVIPGRGDTLRIRGRAKVVKDAPFFDDMVVKGHRPKLALVVEVQALFYHCSKAFLRSELWRPESWRPTDAPRRAVVVKTLMKPDDPIEELDAYYGPGYGKNIYQEPK